jgi:hypothetical protein
MPKKTDRELIKEQYQKVAKDYHATQPQSEQTAIEKAREEKARREAEAKQAKKKAGGKAKKPRTPAQIEATRKLVEFNKARKNKQ